jgi:hypothetical protein
MGNVVDYLVDRRVEHVVESYGCLHHTEVRTHVSAVVAKFVEERFTQLRSEFVEFAD